MENSLQPKMAALGKVKTTVAELADKRAGIKGGRDGMYAATRAIAGWAVDEQRGELGCVKALLWGWGSEV